MPLAVTHVILTIILVDLYRDYISKHKRYFSMHTILVAGIAGLLPDIDILFIRIMNFFGYNLTIINHGGITHTLLFGFIFLIPALILLKKNKHKESMYFFVITFGIIFHLFLDFFFFGGDEGGIMFFWPLSDARYKLFLLVKLGLVSENDKTIPVAIDALILLAWLYHEEIKHKIKDFF